MKTSKQLSIKKGLAERLDVIRLKNRNRHNLNATLLSYSEAIEDLFNGNAALAARNNELLGEMIRTDKENKQLLERIDVLRLAKKKGKKHKDDTNYCENGFVNK